MAMFPTTQQQSRPLATDQTDLTFFREADKTKYEETQRKLLGDLAPVLKSLVQAPDKDTEEIRKELLALSISREEDNAEDEILRKFDEVKFPKMTVQEAVAQNMEYEAQRKMRAHQQSERETQIRRAQERDQEKINVDIMPRTIEGGAGAPDAQRGYTAEIPITFNQGVHKYEEETLYSHAYVDTTHSVQNIDGRWYRFDHTKQKMDMDPLECPRSSLPEIEKSVECLDNMTGKIHIYDTLMRAMKELPTYGYSKNHWTRYFQTLLKQIDQNTFKLWCEETDPNKVLKALTTLITDKNKRQQVEHELRTFTRQPNIPIAAAITSYQALHQQRQKLLKKNNTNTSFLYATIFAIKHLVVPQLAVKISQIIETSNREGEDINIKKLITFVNDQENLYSEYRPREPLSLSSKQPEILTELNVLETGSRKNPSRKGKEKGLMTTQMQLKEMSRRNYEKGPSRRQSSNEDRRPPIATHHMKVHQDQQTPDQGTIEDPHHMNQKVIDQDIPQRRAMIQLHNHHGKAAQ